MVRARGRGVSGEGEGARGGELACCSLVALLMTTLLASMTCFFI